MQEKPSSHRSIRQNNNHIINVPNLFTTISLFCGFLAVSLILSGKYAIAGWIIFMAGIFDALDGRIARASGQSSEFGLQMDSLSDVISSGLAPALLVYQYHLKNLGGNSTLGLMLSFLPLLFATVRLARYNVLTLHGGRKPYYLGLPAPSAATLLASIVILHSHFGYPFLLRVLTIMTVLVSLAMVSHLHYDGFPRFSIRSSLANRLKLAMLLIAMTSMFVWPELTLCVFMMIYFASGPVKFIVQLFSSEVAELEEDGLDGDVLLDPAAEEPA